MARLLQDGAATNAVRVGAMALSVVSRLVQVVRMLHQASAPACCRADSLPIGLLWIAGWPGPPHAAGALLLRQLHFASSVKEGQDTIPVRHVARQAAPLHVVLLPRYTFMLLKTWRGVEFGAGQPGRVPRLPPGGAALRGQPLGAQVPGKAGQRQGQGSARGRAAPGARQRQGQGSVRGRAAPEPGAGRRQLAGPLAVAMAALQPPAAVAAPAFSQQLSTPRSRWGMRHQWRCWQQQAGSGSRGGMITEPVACSAGMCACCSGGPRILERCCICQVW
jgi:hypothetical protein